MGCKLPWDMVLGSPVCVPGPMEEAQAHAAFEYWTNFRYFTASIEEEFPDRRPESVGTVGYDADEGIYVKRADALVAESAGDDVTWYSQWNATSHQPYVHFVNRSSIPPPIQCEDLDAQISWRNWSALSGSHLQCIDGWLTWEVCANRRPPLDACAPLIFNVELPTLELYKLWRRHHMPGMIGFYNGFDYYSIVLQNSVPFYWWTPDATFVDLQPKRITFPKHDRNDWSGIDTSFPSTDLESVRLTKIVMRGLRDVAPFLVKLVENFEVTLTDMMDILMDLIVDYNVTRAACSWLQHRTVRWEPLLPDLTDCSVGRGLLKQIDNSTACVSCAAGKYSQRSQKDYKLYCMACAPGRYQNILGSTGCNSCEPGTYAQFSGMSVCVACARGSFAESGGESSCTPCDSLLAGSTSSESSRSPADCVCPEGTYAQAEVCQDCGTFQTTDGLGATSPSACFLSAEFFVVIFVALAVLVLILLAIAASLTFRSTVWKMEEEQRRKKIYECIRHRSDLAFPLVIMSAADFKNLGQLVSFETALHQQSLRLLATVDQIQEFKRDNKIIFFSHQWLGWMYPDPERVHYHAIVVAIDAILLQMDLEDCHCYVWVDYHSVPQENRQLQTMAVRTLPFFSAMSSFFVIVAPEVEHADMQTLCGLESYQQRMWCRAELFAFYCRRGMNDMYKMVNEASTVYLARLEEDEINNSFFVFEGDCTCCSRNHIGMTVCDKEVLRDVFIGILADVLWSRKCAATRNTLRSQRIEEIARRIEEHRERMFPRMFEATFEKKKSRTQSRIKKSFSVFSVALSGRLHGRMSRPLGDDCNYVRSLRHETLPLFGHLVDTLADMLRDSEDQLQDSFGGVSRASFLEKVETGRRTIEDSFLTDLQVSSIASGNSSAQEAFEPPLDDSQASSPSLIGAPSIISV